MPNKYYMCKGCGSFFKYDGEEFHNIADCDKKEYNNRCEYCGNSGVTKSRFYGLSKLNEEQIEWAKLLYSNNIV